MPLTPKQRRLLDFLVRWIRDHGYSPTYGEIAARLGYRSLSTVSEHLRGLAARGVIRMEHGKPRSIEVLRTDDRVRPDPAVLPPREWLRERCDARAASPFPTDREWPLPLERRYRERWREARGRAVEGDELWTFRSLPDPWDARWGRAGFAVVRGGEVVDGVLAWDGLSDPLARSLPEPAERGRASA